ncbi:hypothetical protein Tco_0386383 [Tanacetum coccineum]
MWHKTTHWSDTRTIAEYDESNTYVLERINTTAGNPVKNILLKLNLSDHRLFKDDGENFKKMPVKLSRIKKATWQGEYSLRKGSRVNRSLDRYHPLEPLPKYKIHPDLVPS